MKYTYTVTIITTLPKPIDKFIYSNVTRYYQEDGMLIVRVKGEGRLHRHNMKILAEVRVRRIITRERWKGRTA